MTLPRWPIIKRLFFGPLLTLLTIALYSIPSSTYYESLLPHLYRFLPALVSLVVLIVATLGAALLFDTWRMEEKALLESELYLVLVTLAVYVFMFLGFLNYSLYALDHKAFTVDKPLEESYSARWRGEMQARLRLHHGNLEVLDALTTRLSEVSLGSFKKVMSSQQLFGWYKYRIAIPVAATKVELDYYLGSDRSRPETRLRVELDAKPVTISDAETLDVASALKALEDKEWVRKEELMGILRAAAQWERTRWIVPLERDLKRDLLMPLSLFLYQGAMDALGSSPKYFEPATALARAVAFCSALAKYLFFGLFLSLLSQRWTSSSTDTAAVSRPSASGSPPEESGGPPDMPLAAPRGMLTPPAPAGQHDRPGPAST
jgi:hypothetical protein